MVPQGWKGHGGSGSMLEVWPCVGYVCGVGFSGVLPLGKPGSGELLLLQVTNTASDTSPSWPSRPPASQRLCFSRAFAPNHPSRRAAGRDASPSCSQGGERHIKLLEKQNNPSVKVTLTNFVVCTNWQANYWAIYCFSCTEGGNIYLLYKQIVHSCFEVSCMIDGAVHRNHKV